MQMKEKIVHRNQPVSNSQRTLNADKRLVVPQEKSQALSISRLGGVSKVTQHQKNRKLSVTLTMVN